MRNPISAATCHGAAAGYLPRVNYRAEKGFSAPPEVVFSVATDPDRIPRWLPDQLRVTDTGTKCLRVAWTDADTVEYRLVVLPDQLRVEWRPAGPDGWAGFLQVNENAAGGASVEVCVEPSGRAGESRGTDQVPRLLDATLVNLRREVADNLSVG